MRQYLAPTVDFDCYETSIEVPIATVVETIRGALDLDVVVPKSFGRWSLVVELKRGDRTFATVKHSDQRPDECHLDCKATASALVPLIRANWSHRVSRVDACIDFYEDVYFDIFADLLRKWAVAHDEYIEPAGAHETPHLGGRTWYKGNRHKKPQRLVRIYEKGCERELKTRFPIRIEHQVRPKSLDKRRYAFLSAAEILLENPFVRHALESVQCNIGEAAPSIPHQPKSDLERTLDTLARQYLKSLRLYREKMTVETFDEFIADLEARAALDQEIRDLRRNPTPPPG